MKKTKTKKEHNKSLSQTNVSEQAMSDNSQHRVPYCTLVSSFKGPVSLVVLLADYNERFALVTTGMAHARHWYFIRNQFEQQWFDFITFHKPRRVYTV